MTSSPREAKGAFDDAVSHTYMAYRFFRTCVPRSDARFPLRIGNFEFLRPSQAESMAVELGWAFFTRLEAAFEALTLRLDLDAKSAVDRLRWSGNFSEEELRGLSCARELRNILHHGDGDASLLRNQPREVKPEVGHEPHLDEDHMDRFVALFRKAADVLTQSPLRVI
jgi:hypothetical protein